jgi:hypothetical protein
VVAGLPGAGKSTALEHLSGRGPTAGLLVLDSASVRAWLQPRFARIPYPVLRPVVHAVHRVRILVSVLADRRPVVVHEPATRPGSRRVLRFLARCSGRPARLVWIEVPGDLALRGQVDRRRVVRRRAFGRHLRRVADCHPVADAGRTWDAVYAVGRDGAPAAIVAAVTADVGSGEAAPVPRAASVTREHGRSGS